MYPRLVIFDLSGTILVDDGAVSEAMSEAFKFQDIPMRPVETVPVAGLPKRVAIKTLLSKRKDPRSEDAQLVQRVTDRFSELLDAHFTTSRRVRAVEGAMMAMDAIKRRGALLAVDTGFDRKIADTILARLGWDKGLFSATVASDEVNRGRPFPDMVFELMKRCAVDNSGHVAKIGDTPNDLLEGKAAMCRWNIGVCEGTHTRFQLEVYPHTHLINNVSYLAQIFDEDF